MLKLLHHPLSTYARRVRIALVEKNVPHELVEIDMAARAHRAPEYLAKNPYGRVPTIEHDGFVLYESAAILDYLEMLTPEPALVPADPKGRALVSMHTRLCDLEFARHATTILFPRRFLPRERWDLAAMEAAKKAIVRHLGIVERQLEGRTWMVGDRFSLVEVANAPFLAFLPLMEIEPGPAVAAWSARIAERPSVRATTIDR
jgi:glutathione S-transferase